MPAEHGELPQHGGNHSPDESQSCGVDIGDGSGGERRRKRRDILDGLLPDVLQIMEKPQTAESDANVKIAGVQSIASYNWTTREVPTIIVPGCPRIWSNPSFPLTVLGESGEAFIDQNSHRLPDYPMLPIFEAVDTLTADGSCTPPAWASIDMITDRNNLLKLAGWSDSSCSSSRSKKDFRIDFELVGPQTVLLQRWEERPCVWAEGAFGDAFEKAAAHPAPGCEDSTLAGSSRVISYDYSGLRIMVRFDVDACMLPDAMSSANVTSSTLPSPRPPKFTNGPAVIHAGHEVPQASLIKIKTRAQGKTGGFPGSAEYLQLLLGQTPTLYVGIHQNGTFKSVKERALESPEFAYSANKVQPGLKKLRRLLEDIRTVAVQRGKETRLSLVCRKGVLQVMTRSGGESLLPGDILQRFIV